MKKYLKILMVLVVALSLLSTFAFATVNSFDDVVKNTHNSSNTLTNVVNNWGASAINIVQTVGYMIAVIMVVVVGIQYLIGTPAKKQELKGRLINVIIGAILIACGVTILGVIENVGNELVDDTNATASISTRV